MTNESERNRGLRSGVRDASIKQTHSTGKCDRAGYCASDLGERITSASGGSPEAPCEPQPSGTTDTKQTSARGRRFEALDLRFIDILGLGQQVHWVSHQLSVRECRLSRKPDYPDFLRSQRVEAWPCRIKKSFWSTIVGVRL